MSIYYSQFGEDMFVNLFFLNKKRDDGFFLELGGLDGILYSNTKFFEDELGFKGILIEPVKEMYVEMVQNRPNSKCYNLAISDKDGEVDLLLNPNIADVSGLKEYVSEQNKSNFHKNSQIRKVISKPLSDILKENNIKYIDFMSIDVEGVEDLILETMDWDIEVYVVCIELDDHNKEKDNKCREILKNNDFLFFNRLGPNDFWINTTYSRSHLLTEPEFFKKTITCIFRNLEENGLNTLKQKINESAKLFDS